MGRVFLDDNLIIDVHAQVDSLGDVNVVSVWLLGAFVVTFTLTLVAGTDGRHKTNVQGGMEARRFNAQTSARHFIHETA